MTSLQTWVLLMTDVEGSTQRWQDEPGAMDEAMRLHHRIVHAAVEDHDGWRPVDQGEGDAVLAAFAAASPALAAAAQAQRALAAAAWPTRAPLRVRMAVHAGEVRVRDGNLLGDPVNRCARIRGLAAGGQVLVSEQAARLGADALPPGARLRPLGEHRLKDLSRPEALLQLDLTGLPVDFPPLPSLDAVRHNLPVQPAPLIGRERELAEVQSALAQHRLVTLTGPGGMGKTRLALQAAAELGVAADAPDIWFVDLAAVGDADLVPARIAEAARLRAQEDPAHALRAAFSQRPTVLVLDNLEQVLDCAAHVAALLADVPTLRILATSREPLRVRAERQLPLPPLELPDGRAAHDAEQVARSQAVRLLVERAQAVRPGFEVTTDNAADIAAVVARLDGHPLSLELAAARLRSLQPATLLARLDRALTVLVGGGRDMPERHRTLRATIAWSAEALTEQERLLLARLSVLTAPADLSVAEVVAGAVDDVPALDLLDALVDRSLVRAVPDADGRTLFSLMQSVREFAAEGLDAQEVTAAWRRLTAHYVGVLPRLDDHHRRALVVHDIEHLRACLAHCAHESRYDDYVRLVAALEVDLLLNGHAAEALEHLERALSLTQDEVQEVPLLLALSIARTMRGQPVEALQAAHQARVLARSDRVPTPLRAEVLSLALPYVSTVGDLQQIEAEYAQLQAVGTADVPESIVAEYASNLSMQLRYVDPERALQLVHDWRSAPRGRWGVHAYRAACVLLDRGRAAEALALLDEVGDRVELVLNAPVWLTNLQTGRATAQLLLGEAEAAENTARACLDRLEEYGISALRIAPVLADALRRQGRAAEAAALLRPQHGAGPRFVLEAAAEWRRAVCLLDLADTAGARAALEAAAPLLEQDELQGPLELLGCRAAQALLLADDQPAEAAALLQAVAGRRRDWVLPFGLDQDLSALSHLVPQRG